MKFIYAARMKMVPIRVCPRARRRWADFAGKLRRAVVVAASIARDTVASIPDRGPRAAPGDAGLAQPGGELCRGCCYPKSSRTCDDGGACRPASSDGDLSAKKNRPPHEPSRFQSVQATESHGQIWTWPPRLKTRLTGMRKKSVALPPAGRSPLMTRSAGLR